MKRNLKSRLDAAREARRPAAPAEGDRADTSASEESDVDRPPDEAGEPQVIDLRTLRAVRDAGRRARVRRRDETVEPEVWDSSPRASMAALLQRRAAQRGEPVPTTNPAQERCPNCGGPVRIDMFDLVTSVAHLTCIDCGFLYTARSPRGETAD